jgi:hypothetical protein
MRHVATLLLAMAAVLPWRAQAQACPGDATPRDAATLLVVQGPGLTPQALDAAALAALPPATLTQRVAVAASGAVPGSERSTAYGGTLLRDLLAKAGFGGTTDRGARTATVEAVATDGYRAVFSWGELFNSPQGEQVIVIATQDGRPLDAATGPLALRALGDLRPGPRHVRNLCRVVVRR